MRGFYFITICSALVALTSCSYTVIKDANLLEPKDGGGTLTKSSLLSWELVKNNVLNTCSNCHLSYKEPELGSLAAVRLKLAKVLEEVNGNDMPPAKDGYSPLDDCRKSILAQWVSENAPENSSFKIGDLEACRNLAESINNPPTPIPLDQAPLNYDTLLTRILQPRCLKCHNPDSDDIEAAGVLFYPYSEILNRSHLWEGPGTQSKIVHSLTDEDEDRRMPKKEDPRLTPEEINFVIRWIDAGIPE